MAQVGLFGRMAAGFRNLTKTVSVGEAYLSKKIEAKKPEKQPELGVLQFGTRFRGMRSDLNPFQSGVRPATGPTVARPGGQQFVGTGGAFAPENAMGLTSGLRGLSQPLDRVGGVVNTLQGLQNQVQGLGGMDVAQQMQDIQMSQMLQNQIQHISRMFTTITNILRAAHDVAMNSIRNTRA